MAWPVDDGFYHHLWKEQAVQNFFSNSHLVVSKYVDIGAQGIDWQIHLTSDEARLIWLIILNVKLWYREFAPQQSRPIENFPRNTIA